MVNFENMTAEHYQVDAESPIDNFSHCHIGLLHHFERLAELLHQLKDAEAASKIAQETLNYFHLGLHAHHQEEEVDLFPAVLKSAMPGDELTQVQAMVDRLILDHQEMESAWKQLEPALKEIIKGHVPSVDHVHFQILINRFKAHARSEETLFLPLAEKVLGRNSNHMAALGLSLHMRHLPHIPTYI